MHRLLAEWWTQPPWESETTVYMDLGKTREEEAVRLYEHTTGRETQEVGFCTTDDGQIGCSPDRLVGDEGLLEVKCPLPSTQVGYLLHGELPTEYTLQVQGQLYVTGRAWCDFLSYFPGLPPLLLRVRPEPTVQAALKKQLDIFCADLAFNKIRLRALAGKETS